MPIYTDNESHLTILQLNNLYFLISESFDWSLCVVWSYANYLNSKPLWLA